MGRTWQLHTDSNRAPSLTLSLPSWVSSRFCQIKRQVIKSLTRVRISPFPTPEKGQRNVFRTRNFKHSCGITYAVEDCEYGGNYAVEADKCKNQNPVKSAVLFCSCHSDLRGSIALVSWKKRTQRGFSGLDCACTKVRGVLFWGIVTFHEYKDQITCFCYQGRREGVFHLASVEGMVAGIHPAEHETDRRVFCVFVQTHFGHCTGTGAARVVVNLFHILKKVECHQFCSFLYLWTWHGHIFSGGNADSFQRVWRETM